MISSINKFIAATLVLILTLSTATSTLAQSSPDTRSPVIELEAVAESLADQAQVFTAQVVDDRILKDVILYYRREGQQAFSPVPMNPIAETAYFTTSVETDPTDLRAIEYYVQARDEGGNRTVQGYAFDPYTRVLIKNTAITSAPTTAASSSNAPIESAETSSTGLRWWQIALGVVVVGALAAAAGGGSGSGTSEEGTVPLTVTVTGL